MITMNFVGPDSSPTLPSSAAVPEALNANPAAIGFAAVTSRLLTALQAMDAASRSSVLTWCARRLKAPYANASIDNYYAGGVAAEGMWAKIMIDAAAEGAASASQPDATGVRTSAVWASSTRSSSWPAPKVGRCRHR